MRLPLVFILITLALDAIAIGLILPVMPELIGEVTGAGLADAALWGGILTTSFAIMQFLFGPILGALSDRFGRKPVLLGSLAVLALDYALMAMAHTIWLLLLGRIIAGIAAATYPTAAAFIADVTPPERKAGNFGLIGAAFGVGFILGPAMGGLLAEWGTRAPFVAAGLLATANLAFGAVVLRESLAPENRRPLEISRANPVTSLMRLKAMRGIGALIAVYFLYELAMIAYPATWAYFTAARFGWTPGTIGVSLALFGVSFAVVQGGFVRLAVRRWGEVRTIVFGLGANAVTFITLATIADGDLALMLLPMTSLGAVVVPGLQSMMSARVPDNRQGELQGLVASARAVALIFGPMLMTGVFFAFTRPGSAVYLPGAAFVVSMALMGLCLVVFARARAVGGDLAPEMPKGPRGGIGH